MRKRRDGHRECQGVKLFNCSKEELGRHGKSGVVRKVKPEQRTSVSSVTFV